MDRRPHWLAGPISYKTTDTGLAPNRTILVCKWEFIGGTANGEIRRWHLAFSLETRKFTANTLSVTHWEKAHASDLADTYRPSEVRLEVAHPEAFLDGRPSMEGTITSILKQHLKPEDIAKATALAITQNRSSWAGTDLGK